MKKNIVFLTESMVGAGGVVRVITTWANYFSQHGYECKILSVINGEPYFPLHENIKFKIKKYFFKWKLFSLPLNIFAIIPILKESKNSILVVNKSAYIEPIYILRKLGLFKNIELVYFSHGGNGEFESFYMSRPLTRHRVKMIFSVFNNIVCLFKNTEITPDCVIDEKIIYIPNPCPLKIYNKDINTESNIISFIGRVTKEKGVDILIKAWHRIEDKYTDWKLQIIGDGKDKQSFEKLADSLKIKRVTFIPATNDICDYLKETEISVLPSLFEGMPMSIIEARSQGCALISTKTNGGKKLIDDHENGLLVNINDEYDLAEKIELLITDKELRSKLISNGYLVAANYNIEKIAENWKDIL
ncbi:MAG: glycosyltransferase [Morganella sp. (in: enterobacteria)]